MGKRLEADIVICSAGSSALAAAITAAEGGASVIAVEKAARPGGNGNMANGPFAVESRLQKVKQYTLTREEAYRMHMDFTQWSVNARLVKTYIDRSAGTLDWLEKMGIEFYDTGSHGNGNCYTWHLMKTPSRGPWKTPGLAAMGTLTKRAKEVGVQILLKTPVNKIIKKNGSVTGVMATSRDGEKIQIDARAVIVATGGYGAYWRAPFGIPLSGDGIHMAQEVGADTTDGTLPLKSNGKVPRDGRRPRAAALREMSLNTLFNQPVLMVNFLGERFIDEEVILINTAGGNAIVKQKNGHVFSILDEDTKNYYNENGLDFMDFGGVLNGGNPNYRPVNFDKELKKIFKKGSDNIFEADSIDELAAKTGINPVGLKRTIEEYNRACETGRDEAFGKKSRYLRPVKQPKFYASKYFPFLTPGKPEGIKINHRMEVLTKDHDVIPGLYAAGMDTACNIYRDAYVNCLPGNAFGWALNSGRMVAENALEYIKSLVIF